MTGRVRFGVLVASALIGTPDVLAVAASSSGRELVLSGKKAGQSSLLLIRPTGPSHRVWVHVYPKLPEVVARELSDLVGKLAVRVRRVGGHFFLEGTVATEGEAKRCAQIAALYPGQVESVVSQGLPDVDRRLLVRIDFFFTQYDRSSGYAVGIGWPASIGADAASSTQLAYDFAARSTSGTSTVLVRQPLPRLDVAARHGWAKVVKQSTVITSNGSAATFESGGEQNYSVNTGLTIGVQKIQFGANVTVLPIFDPSTRELELRLEANVADLTAPVASALPGRSTSKLVTNVHLKVGQSLVLSGIRTQSRTHDVQGLPGLSEIPVFGLLFGSHQDLKNEIEGAIFIVPSLVESVPKSTSELIERTLDNFTTYQGEELSRRVP